MRTRHRILWLVSDALEARSYHCLLAKSRLCGEAWFDIVSGFGRDGLDGRARVGSEFEEKSFGYVIGCVGRLPFCERNLHIITQYGIANEIDDHVGEFFSGGIALLEEPGSAALNERVSVVQLMVIDRGWEWHKHGRDAHGREFGE